MINVKGLCPAIAHGAFSRHIARLMGMSQEELADRCGLHRTYIGGVERAERNVSLLTLELLAAGLRCNPADLLVARRARRSKR